MDSTPQHLAIQPALFGELIESIITRDAPFEDRDGAWGSRISRGWRVIDAHRERHTKWTRRTPIIWPVRPSSGGCRRR